MKGSVKMSGKSAKSAKSLKCGKQSVRFTDKRKNTLLMLVRLIIVFVVPIIVGRIMFRKLGIYPYKANGTNSLLSIDLWTQYFPMYRQFAQTDSISEAIYSWNGALGYNSFVQNAFYCRSLFLLIFKHVSMESSIAFIDSVALLRFGLSALTCQLLFEYKFRDSNKKPVLMAISLCYGLCSYAICFVMQWMWTDCIFLAPLVILGLEMLLDKKSPLLYTAALALTIYTNFYLGFGVCIFTALYFLAETIRRTENEITSHTRKETMKSVGQSVLRFAIYSIIAGCLTAVILIPTLKGLSLSMSANEGKLDFKQWYHTLADNMNALLPETGASLEYGVANIATGLAMFILIPLFFTNTEIKFGQKIGYGGFLFALYAGLNYNPADYVFNGFHFPNQLPGRWSFLFSLALVIVAASGIEKRGGIKLRSIITSLIMGMFFVFMARYSTMTQEKQDHISSWIRLLVIFAVIMIFEVAFSAYSESRLKKAEKLEAEATAKNPLDEKKQKNCIIASKVSKYISAAMSVVLAVAIAYEGCSNAYKVAVSSNGMRTSSMESYNDAMSLFTKYGEKYDSGDDDFYRMEVNQGWTFNDGVLGDFKGMTYYGSTLNGKVFSLLRYLGNAIYALNVSTIYNHTSPVQNGIFGVRYIIDRGKNLDSLMPGMDLVETGDDCYVWENKTALPIAYAVDPAVTNFKVDDQLRPLSAQNRLMNLMCGGEVNAFEKQTPSAFTCSNCQLDENEDWNKNYFYRTDPSMAVTFNYTYVCPDEQPLYLENNFRAGNITMTVNGAETKIDVGSGLFKYIGSFPAGTEVNFAFDVTGVEVGCFGLDVYRFDMEKWKSIYNNLSSGGLDVTSFDYTKIDGKIDMKTDGTVMSSITQDGGWDVYVDGEKVDTYTVAGALVAFDLNAGQHDITYRYHTPGLPAGICVTLVSLAAFVACWLVWRKRNGLSFNVPFIKKKDETADPKSSKKSAKKTKSKK